MTGPGVLEHDEATAVVTFDACSSREAWGDLRTEVRRHLVDGRERIVIDLTGLGRLSSAAVAGLLSAKRYVRAWGGQVVVRGHSSGSLDTLARAGLVGARDRPAASGLPGEVPGGSRSAVPTHSERSDTGWSDREAPA